MDATSAERLHTLMMELVRVSGLLQPEFGGSGGDITFSQAFALHELDTDRPLSQRDLAERLRLEKSTVSRMAADLERRGLLVRERDPANRRLYRLRLTPEGRRAHVRMAAGYHERFEGWIAQLTPGERDALLTGLPALVRAMSRGPTPWGDVPVAGAEDHPGTTPESEDRP